MDTHESMLIWENICQSGYMKVVMKVQMGYKQKSVDMGKHTNWKVNGASEV